MPEVDCRDEVFCERGHEVLGSVVQGTQMALPDPFDVEKVHAEARQAFHATLDDVTAAGTSKILLIVGEAGCGKTHLIRALRTQIHREKRGVIAYVHMTSEQGDYRRYLLRQVVRSLSDGYQYDPDRLEQFSALDLISDALVKSSGLENGAAEKLAEADDESLAGLVSEYADVLSEIRDEGGRLRYADVDLNVLRTLLYRHSTRKPIQRRVNGFLNGEPLSALDWQKLAALPPDCERGPMHLLGQLARITAAAVGSPLIICVDQIEASDITGKNHDPFIRAMSTACELIENVPKLMLVSSCLDSAYESHAPHLITSYRHRIENDPSRIVLTAARNSDEIRWIVSRRLKELFEGVGLQHVPPDSVYPMPERLPDQLARQHLRDILQQVHRYWEQCHHAASIVEWKPEDASAAASTLPQEVDRLRLAWNEFHTAGDYKVPENELAHLDLLAWALKEIPNEWPERSAMVIENAAELFESANLTISFALTRVGAVPLRRLVGLCEKDARGNGLYNQVAALQTLRKSADQGLVVVRSTRFPAKGKLAEHLRILQESGDVCQVIEETCWETMQALREFLRSGMDGFSTEVINEWRKSDLPLAGLGELRAIVNRRGPEFVPAAPQASDAPILRPAPKRDPTQLPPDTIAGTNRDSSPNDVSPALPAAAPVDHLVLYDEAPFSDASITSQETVAAIPVPVDGPMVIGTREGFDAADVTLDPQALTRHTAIFGANASGKTALAMNIVEMLLERGVAVVLFDRNGDLANYADENAWAHQTGAPDEDYRRRALRDRIDIALYTPGAPSGRPLVIPFLPGDIENLDEVQRRERTSEAAMILHHVCAPTPAKADMFATVLSRAIELLCTTGAMPHTLANLEHILLSPPQGLLALLPGHDARNCEEVGRRLHEQRTTNSRLFSDQGEQLDLRRMLFGSQSGRVPLTIICTQFLDDDSSLTWIAQFLAAAGAFARQHPSPDDRLRALLMFDDADRYIPAASAPITKPAMENLLRQAQTAGVGIMLASQNVGQFDGNVLENITTVFAGKLTTGRAIEKLRSRFGDAVEKLSRKTSGHFLMAVENNVLEIAGHMPLLKPATKPREEIERMAAGLSLAAGG